VRTSSLLLKAFQSVDERYPSTDDVACERANTPVRLLYVRGPRAERAVRVILDAMVPARDETEPEREARLVLIPPMEPERVATEPERIDTDHEREAILPVAVVRFELMVAIDPVMVLMFVSVEVIRPESVFTVPERAFCARVLVK
jgi:hypothetical protein